MMNRTPPAVASLDWPDFMARFDWRQGEHVTLLGPTGTGKTTAAVQLLERRGYVCAIGTKPKDSTFDYLRRRLGYELVPTLPAGRMPPAPPGRRVIVWPRMTTLDRAAKRAIAGAVRDTLDRAYSVGGWTLFCDELAYITNTLKLAPELGDLWQQGRAAHVSLIGCSQRPRHIPLDAYSAATHLFMWRTNDDYDLKRLAGLNGVDSALVRRLVPQLPPHHVLYVSTRTGAMCVTLAPRL